MEVKMMTATPMIFHSLALLLPLGDEAALAWEVDVGVDVDVDVGATGGVVVDVEDEEDACVVEDFPEPG